MDFLADNNICGQIILKLVARGNSILSELLRLSQHVPIIFKFDSKPDLLKYGEVIFDFSYFKSPAEFEKKVENSKVLFDLDEDIRESHGSIIARIYSAFESINRYISDLLAFINEVREGVYFPNSLENIFRDADGKQLMCEALFLYGCMLLITDSLFTGVVRERIIVAYQRYTVRSSLAETNIDDVCKLLRSTGYCKRSGGKKPQNYPESFLMRIEIPEDYINLVIGHLRSDDVYHQVRAYPSPDQRSTALSTQAAMLCICLFFSPTTLHNNTSRMREIVDKFFPDNWIISYYMGNTLNLIDIWEPYKAARCALNNTIEVSNLKEKMSQMKVQLADSLELTEKLVADGGLTELKVLDNGNKILSVLRDCNVALRWIILHSTPLAFVGGEQNKKCVYLRSQVISENSFSPEVIFQLLLNTSLIELSMNKTYKKLLNQKVIKWDSYRKAAHEETVELAEVFSGSKPLVRVAKNEKLNHWFKDIAEQVMSLSLDCPSFSGCKILQIIQALKEVKEFHQLDANTSVVQALGNVIGNLRRLIRVANVSEDNLVTLALISDLSYAWNLIDCYTTVMQESIKKDPSKVSLLRATFMKLSSGLELPLLRINQAKSPDLISVSEYYSSHLIGYIRKVLQVIPETMFSLLENIIHLQSTMKDIPTRLDKDKIRDFAQLDERYKMAELTQRVAVLAEGVSMMESTLVGVVQVDPKKLLEEGVRREMLQQVATALHHSLSFNPKSKHIEEKLRQLAHQMQSFQKSFEYIEDYINIRGLKLWQEEMHRIVNFNVEEECNQLLKRNVCDWESTFQNSAVPIPKFPSLDNQSVNFIGRLAREIIRITNPRTTIYISQLETWYDCKTHQEVLDSTVMESIEESLCIAGLAGIDRLIAFFIVRELQHPKNPAANVDSSVVKAVKIIYSIDKFQEFCNELDAKINKDETISDVYVDIMSQNLDGEVHPHKIFSAWMQKTQKVNALLMERLLKVGQAQILRVLAANRLNSSCKLTSKLLASAIEAFNMSLMSDVRSHYLSPDSEYPDREGRLCGELTAQLDWCGMSEPLEKIYVIPKKTLSHVSAILFLIIISFANKVFIYKTLGPIPSNKSYEHIDGTPFAIGIATVLHQVHKEQTGKLLTLLGIYISSLTAQAASQGPSKNPELSMEAANVLSIFQEVATKMDISSNSQVFFLLIFEENGKVAGRKPSLSE